MCKPEFPKESFTEIVEGKTRLLVPKKSIIDRVPPKKPAFFNPKARLSRDFSIITYSAFLKSFDGPKIVLDGLSGIGARGLRVANELSVERVVINDLNPSALKMAQYSASLNKANNIEFFGMELCRFLSKFSEKGNRGTVVDIDPFGSPAAFFDCGIRATMHGGMLSVAATDLQVLNGLFQDACMRRYGGVPVRTEYGKEIAIRLILGCLRAVAGRIGVKITPVFAESNMHYYRIYVKVFNKPDQERNLGYITHCKSCSHREIVAGQKQECDLCQSKASNAGPLWTGKIFDKPLVKDMLDSIQDCKVDKACEKTLEKCLLESDTENLYFTLDEIAAKTRASPPKLEAVMASLKRDGFAASPTSFSPTGFRTNANILDVTRVFQSIQ